MKNLFFTVLAVVILTACGGSGGNNNGENITTPDPIVTTPTDTTSTPDPTPIDTTPTPTTGPSPDPTPTPVPTPTDTTPPTVASVGPANDAVNVSVSANIAVTFNEAVDCAAVGGTNLMVGEVAGNVTCSGQTVTFTPASSFAFSTSYQASVAGIKDLAGNVMASSIAWSFTTEADPTLWQLPADAYETTRVSDNAGNQYVSGTTLGAFSGFTNAGDRDVFLVKFNPNGTFAWAYQTGTINYDGTNTQFLAFNGEEIFLCWMELGQNTTYISSFNQNGYIKTINVPQVSGIPAAGAITADNSGIYLAVGWDGSIVKKIDFDGTVLWSAPNDFGGNTSMPAIALDKQGNVYVTGGTDGAAPDFVNAGSGDMVVAKYDATTGNRLWIDQWGLSSLDDGRGIAITSSAISINGITYDAHTVMSYVCRVYDVNGNLLLHRVTQSEGSCGL